MNQIMFWLVLAQKTVYHNLEPWSIMMVSFLIIVDCMSILIPMLSSVAGNVEDPVTASSHGFTSKNEKLMTAYLDHLEKYLLDHKVESRINTLLEQAPNLSRKAIKCRYEAIDRDVTQGMVSSEGKVHKKQFKYEWSITLDQAGYHIRYWKTRYSDLKNHSFSPTALARLKQRADLKDSDDNMSWNLDQVLSQLKAAQAELNDPMTEPREMG